ncbi:MAG: NAD(P)-dependent alcohol dehydrogenase [Candidatus Sulfotelmatobacter sp.]
MARSGVLELYERVDAHTRYNPDQMKGAFYTKAKSGKILEIKELEQPIPKDQEVVLKVRAASVNPLDWSMKVERPGVDVAGEIVAVGRAVTLFELGDALFGVGKGTFAEYARAPEAKLAPKPESVSFEQTAAVPIAGLTALQALRDKGRLQSNQKVLINGAAGGIGTLPCRSRKHLALMSPAFAARRMSNWCALSVPTES